MIKAYHGIDMKRNDMKSLPNSTGGFFIINPRGVVTFADSMSCSLFGYTQDELTGQSFEQIIANGLSLPDLVNSEVERKSFKIEGIKKDKSRFHAEIKLESFHVEKELLFIAFLSIPIERTRNAKSQNGETTNADNLAGNAKIIDDLQLQIQKRKEIEQKLVNIQRLYDTVVHNFPDGVIGVLNREMKYVLMDGKELNEINLPSLGLGGLRKKEGTNLGDQEILNKVRNVFDGELVEFEIDNDGRSYSISCVPLPDMANRINEILFVIKNITERKRMEEGLHKALEKEKELGELKSRIVTMASHEFKTPLAMILSSAFLLEKFTSADYEKEKKEHTNRITQSVNSLTLIINQILAIEKLDENLVQVTNTVLLIPNLFRNCISEIELTKQEEQNIVYRHIGTCQTVCLDWNLLWGILTNLISNGLKYSKKGDTVHITSTIKNKSLTIEVSDNGMGIPADEQVHIFERFFRARNAMNIEGTGLGLYIVEKNVKLLKGSIQFTNNDDGGTKFIVVIPDGQLPSQAKNSYESKNSSD